MREKLKRFLKRRLLPFFLICFGAFILFVAMFWLKCAFVKPPVGPLPQISLREKDPATDVGGIGRWLNA